MDPLLLIPIVWLIGIPIAIIVRNSSKKEGGGDETKKIRYLDGHELTETRLFLILVKALRSLERQHAAGYRSWLSSCIERLGKGLEVPPEIALNALYMTRDELSGPRYEKEGQPTVYYNLDGLNEAIVTLETQMGERE